MSFERVVVCFTGLPMEVRVSYPSIHHSINLTPTNHTIQEEKARLVLEMRGRVSRELNATVTHLVAADCDPGAEKYRAARHMQLPVMRVEWIDEGYRAHQALNPLAMSLPAVVEIYRCPLFTNCVSPLTHTHLASSTPTPRFIFN